MQTNNNHHFSTILASTVHDIKNSLGTLQQLVHQISTAQKDTNNPDIIQLEFESNRINHSMMQLLVLYKIDSDRFSLDIDEYPVDDILDEVMAQLGPLLKVNHIELEVDYPEDLLCFCDQTHISNALGTIINNAQRFCRNKILLSACQKDDYVCFSIEDDGPGYPQDILSEGPFHHFQMNWVTGNTGLGLYFASTIAELHHNEKKGFIRIDNNSRLGGARFSVFLP